MSESREGNVLVKVLKVLGWTILTTVVVLSVLLFCAVKFINSKQLSPFVERVANDYIDGHLKLGSLKVGFHPAFPILGIEVKDLSIISHTFDSLTVEQRGLLPNYADSLLTLDYMAGSLDIKRLMVDNELALHNVVMRGLGVNIVIAHNGKANYELIKQSTDTSGSPKKKMSGFRINRFALEKPKEIRFYNAADSTSASVLLLTDAAVEGDKQPTYRLKINGNVTSPKATLITNLDNISFGLNGKVYWNPEHPGLVAMDDMELQGAFIKAIVSGELDLDNSPIIRKLKMDLGPVALADLLTMVPDSIRSLHHLYDPYFSTDLAITGSLELAKPMDLTTDTLPEASIKLTIPPSTLRYGKAIFKEIVLDATVNTMTNLPDSTLVNIERCIVAGPATRFEASAFLSKLLSDPSFETDMEGEIDLANLPPIIREKIPGYLSGIISTDLHAKGSTSMFRPEHIHRLKADGFLTAKNLYFLSADTNNMVELSQARFDFDSKRTTDDMPELHTKLSVDTATILRGGVDISLGSLSLDAAIDHNYKTKANSAKTHSESAHLMPVDGNLKLECLNIISITDSAGAHIRNIGGHVTMRELNGKPGIPKFIADLQTGRVSAGTLSDRILLNDTKIKATLHKLPKEKKNHPVARNSVNTHKEYSYIEPSKVFKYVYAKRHHKPGEKKKRRVYGEIGADDNEVLTWDLAKGFSRFLNDWKLQGSVNTHNGQLLTPFFPVHNRFSSIDVRFSNDTVGISNISLRAGRSDITMSGIVSNVRRGLTSKTNNTLKGNFSILSDTIDINELSAGVMTGASYADSKRHGKILKMATDDDATLQARLDALAKKGAGKAAPLLIPVNIDANLRIEANMVLYSDITMEDMGGDILVYDGGVNLHNIQANSDAGSLTLSALYSAPKLDAMHFGFGMEVKDFNIGKFVKLVPAIDSITPLMHDFSGMIGADIAATCRIDSGMNLDLPTLNAAIRITGDNLSFIDPKKYRTLGKWLGFKNKADNTIHSLNVEMTVEDGLMRVYPFAFNIDRYRLGVYGSNDIAMNFDYHLSVLKSPLPFKFGITVSGNPKKYKVRFGGAKFKEDTAIESVSVVNEARINLIDQIENVFKRGVRNSRFAKLQIAHPTGFDTVSDQGLSAADSLRLIQEGLIEAPTPTKPIVPKENPKKKRKRFLFF